MFKAHSLYILYDKNGFLKFFFYQLFWNINSKICQAGSLSLKNKNE